MANQRFADMDVNRPRPARIAFCLRSYYADLYSRVGDHLIQDAKTPAELLGVFSDAYVYERYGNSASWKRSYCLTKYLREKTIFQWDRETALSRIPIDYRADMWNLVYSDRSLSRLDREKILQKFAGYVSFFEEFLEQEKPDCLVICELALCYELVALHAAKRRGIQCIIPTLSRLPFHRIALTENARERWVGLKEYYTQKKMSGLSQSENDEVDEFIRLISVHKRLPVYKLIDTKWSTLTTRFRELQRLSEYLGTLYSYLAGDRHFVHYEILPVFLAKLRRNIWFASNTLRRERNTSFFPCRYFQNTLSSF
jgi:hypothetical protein